MYLESSFRFLMLNLALNYFIDLIMLDRTIVIFSYFVQNYRVGVVFNKAGWYPLGVCSQNVSCDTVFFTFGVGNNAHTVRESLIRSIVFTYH